MESDAGQSPQKPEQQTPETAPVQLPGQHRETPAWLNGVFAAFCLYLFLCAIKVMGKGLKTLASDPEMETRIRGFLEWSHNPVMALMASVFVTAVVQSSSFTTSLIIILAADGIIDLQTAVYMVMGANIGTSVTNILVSLGNIRIKRQFRRAFTAALVHDVFNWLTVFLLFPIEWISSAFNKDGFGFLAHGSIWLSEAIGFGKMPKSTNPISVITSPVIDAVKYLTKLVNDSNTFVGTALAIIGLLMLFASLIFLVKNLKGALLRRIEALFRRVFFRNDLLAYIVGAITTILVQSSSVTTSLIVPLAGAGAVKIKRVFPYTLGANLGTTITGVIAASAKIGTPLGVVAVAVAISHVTFNLIGTAIWYPLRRIPISIARWYGRVAADSKRYAILFLLLVFFVIPAIAIAITEVIMYLL